MHNLIPRLFLVAAFALPARAGAALGSPKEAADALVREGVAFAELGRLEEALARFRSAESLFPRALHYCNIGLALARLDRWPAAHAALSHCASRSTEELPGWVGQRLSETETALRAGPYAAVEVVSLPPGAALSVSAVLEEVPLVAPTRIWLPFGDHEVVGQWGEQRAVVPLRVTQRTALRVELARPTPALASERAAESAQVHAPQSGAQTTWGWVCVGVGAASLVAGAVLHGFAADASSNAGTNPPGPDFDAALEHFERLRGGALGAYASSAALVAVGVALIVTDDSDEPSSAVELGPSHLTVRF